MFLMYVEKKPIDVVKFTKEERRINVLMYEGERLKVLQGLPVERRRRGEVNVS